MMNALPPNNCNILLEAKGLKKSFFFRNSMSTVLEAVDFSICHGEFVSIIGASGCGKSTFLELLAGITKPDSGRIYLEKADITGQTGLLGYMPQDDLLFPWLNTIQNILIPVKVKNGDIIAARKKIDELLPVFGLQNHATHYPHQLSGGLKQRVALLRTYMCNARAILLDEPLASLDSLTRSQLQDWLKEIVELLKLTIILVTHDIDEAIVLSDRIELMRGHPGRFGKSIDISSMGKMDIAAKHALKTDIQAMFRDNG